jgi:hypothetical protein
MANKTGARTRDCEKDDEELTRNKVEEMVQDAREN